MNLEEEARITIIDKGQQLVEQNIAQDGHVQPKVARSGPLFKAATMYYLT